MTGKNRFPVVVCRFVPESDELLKDQSKLLEGYGMRWIDLVVAIMFIVMALIQLNDADPGYWVLIYGGTGVLGLAAAVNRFSYLWTAIAIGAVVVGMLSALPGFLDYFQSGDPASLTGAMLPEKPWVEPAREFLGLAMALAALLWYLRRSRSTDRMRFRR